jgi:hypothetical protein
MLCKSKKLAQDIARAAGNTESTGLGADRLTAARKARAAELRAES